MLVIGNHNRLDSGFPTTYLSLTYTESDGVNIKVDALELISTEKDYVQIELVFTTVAEVKCATVNFHEII